MLATSIIDVVLQREQGDTKFVDKNKPKVQEIVQVYGGSIQDSKHFGVGRQVQLRLALKQEIVHAIGVPVAWVPGFFSVLGSLMYPFT